MQLEKIFELVRKEDVVFWIGSGFSLYAGYPTGKQLANTIHQSLTPMCLIKPTKIFFYKLLIGTS